MKHHSFAGAFLALAMILGTIAGVAPLETSAQRSSEWSGGDREEISRWRRANDRIRRAIEDLGEDPVVNLPMPILFGVSPSNIFPNFGDPRSGGRSHEGEDIMAPRGAPIISPTEAVVIGMGVWSGAGNYVSTANPGGETFVYMHLDDFADIDEGDVLRAGDLIGYVGNTGNASGGAPHLHFEIRQDREATDPFPRLRAEFSLAQKIGFVENMIDESDDEERLAGFLVANYRTHFLAAQALGIELPDEILDEMKSVSATGATAVASFPGDLTLGSSGSAVVALQNFLISRNTGPAARALAGAGATGNFGPITRSALTEYQKSVGIIPADGYYGPLTRAYVQQVRPVATTPVAPTAPTTPTPVTPAVPPPTTANLVPTRDLKLGASGPDVTWLQTFLAAVNSGPAAVALARAGSTGYFGSITQAALAEYQAKTGISPAVGYFGPLTRARITAALQ